MAVEEVEDLARRRLLLLTFLMNTSGAVLFSVASRALV
jgi:hypothetical protein